MLLCCKPRPSLHLSSAVRTARCPVTSHRGLTQPPATCEQHSELHTNRHNIAVLFKLIHLFIHQI